MNVEIRTEAAQFLFWEYTNWFFVAVLYVNKMKPDFFSAALDNVAPIKKNIVLTLGADDKR
jgi:hypothetical protein